MSGESVQDQPGLDVLVNFPISDAIHAAPADPEQAAKVLLLAARLMRDRRPMPYELADYLANAFEKSIDKPIELRVQNLAFELNLKSRNKRPSKFGWLAAHKIMVANEGKTRGEIIKLIQKLGKVSRAHANRMYDMAKRAEREHQLLCWQEFS